MGGNTYTATAVSTSGGAPAFLLTADAFGGAEQPARSPGGYGPAPSPIHGSSMGRAREQPHTPCLVRAGEQWHPLVCVIPQALLPVLQSAWEAGQRSPWRWLAGQPHTVLQLMPDDPRLHNANTLADWSAQS